jgi:mono/diheme cytochrome c family protein
MSNSRRYHRAARPCVLWPECPTDKGDTSQDDTRPVEPADAETTGHEWDGIKELNNPLPRWWLWTFYATIIWSLGYVVAYPAIPMIEDASKGWLGYSSRGELAREIEQADAGKAEILARVSQASLREIADDPVLFRFATAGGRSAFKVHCSQCHGAGAAGSSGYPNLNDDDWLWSGTLEGIAETITHGVRFERDDYKLGVGVDFRHRRLFRPQFQHRLEQLAAKRVGALGFANAGDLTQGGVDRAEEGFGVRAHDDNQPMVRRRFTKALGAKHQKPPPGF